MIVGMILDVDAGSGATGNGGTGAMMHFYNWEDAVNWARDTSEVVDFGGPSLRMFTMIYNCNTEVKRWFRNGTEYTG